LPPPVLFRVEHALRACLSLRVPPAAGRSNPAEFDEIASSPRASLGVLAMTVTCGAGAPRRQARAERVSHACTLAHPGPLPPVPARG